MPKSKMFKTLIFGITMIIQSSVFAEPIQSKAEKLLQADLRPAIKSLLHETRLYHYFNINLNGADISDSAFKNSIVRYNMANSRVKKVSSSFWNLENNNTHMANAGLGLYLAVDPFSSSPAAANDSGGNFGPYMLEITFNSGTKYLDLLKAVPLKLDTIKALIEETELTSQDVIKLFSDHEHVFSRNTLQFMSEAQNTNFRKLVQNIFYREGISLTEYGWQSGVTSLCNYKNHSGRIHHSALVYVGNENTQNAIKSVTMIILNTSNELNLDNQEFEASQRNQKLFNVLKFLRPLEKSYQTAYKNNDKTSIKILYSEIKSTINSSYPNELELLNIQKNTFNCSP